MTGAELKQRRKELNHSIASASLLLGVSDRTLCRWERLPELPKQIRLLTKKLRKK